MWSLCWLYVKTASAMRFNMDMLLAAHGSGSGNFLTSPGLGAALAILSTLGVLTTLALQYIASHPRRRIITVGMPVSARLVDRSVPLPNLHVLYGDEELADAHVSTVVFSYRGGGNIRVQSFEDSQSFCIDLGARIIDLVGKTFEPTQAPVPKVEVTSKALRIGPSLVRSGQVMTFVVLTDGPCRLTPENPLADVEDRIGASYQAQEDEREDRHQARRRYFVRVLSWAALAYIAFYVLTQPTAATHFLNSLGNALADLLNAI